MFQKKWLWALSVLVFILIIFVGLIPTFLSTQWGQNKLISMVNERIPGKFSADSIHLSWFGPQTIEKGLLQDPSNQEVANFNSLSTDIPLFKLLFRKFLNQNINVAGLNLLLIGDASGQTNLDNSLGRSSPLLKEAKGKRPFTITLSNLNAFANIPSSSRPIKINLDGQTQENSIVGHFEVDIELLKKVSKGRMTLEAHQLNADIINFPVALIDTLVSLWKPELLAISQEVIGEALDLSLQQKKIEDNVQFSLKAKASNLFIDAQGALEEDRMVISPASKATILVTPQLYEHLLKIFESPLPFQLAAPTKTDLIIDQCSMPIGFLTGDEGDYNFDLAARLYLSDLAFQGKLVHDLITLNKVEAILQAPLNSKEVNLQLVSEGNQKDHPFNLRINSKFDKPRSLAALLETLKWQAMFKGGKVLFDASLNLAKLNLEDIDVVGALEVNNLSFRVNNSSGKIKGRLNATVNPANQEIMKLLGSGLELDVDGLLHKDGERLTVESFHAHGHTKLMEMDAQGRIDRDLNLILSTPIDISYLLTQDFFEVVKLADKLTITKSTPIKCRIDPFRLSLRDLKQEMLSGEITVDALEMVGNTPQAILIKNLELPWEIDLMNGKAKLKALGNTQFSNQELGKLQAHVNIENLLDGRKLSLENSFVAVDLKLKSFPTLLLGGFSYQKELVALLGETVDGNLNFNVQQLYGYIEAAIVGSNGKANLSGNIENGILTLNRPLEAEIQVTPQLASTALQDVIPVLGNVYKADEPIHIVIKPDEFSFPLKDFKIEKIAIGQGKIALGKVHFTGDGPLSAVFQLLGANNHDQLSVWFTPLYFSMAKGVVHLNRMDMLLMEQYPMAIWGTVNSVKDKVDMRIGMTGATLAKAFKAKNLDKDYMLQLPLRGSTSNPAIDKTQALARISSLVAQRHGTAEGLLIGTVLGIASGEVVEDLPPAPTTNPLPWKLTVPDEEPTAAPKKEKKEKKAKKEKKELAEQIGPAILDLLKNI